MGASLNCGSYLTLIKLGIRIEEMVSSIQSADVLWFTKGAAFKGEMSFCKASFSDDFVQRQGWSKPNSFHVCITSYKLVIQDQTAFRRKKWKYLILDEAQHIKNFRSQRWQTLLNFNSKRRLLLTGIRH